MKYFKISLRIKIDDELLSSAKNTGVSFTNHAYFDLFLRAHTN